MKEEEIKIGEIVYTASSYGKVTAFRIGTKTIEENSYGRSLKITSDAKGNGRNLYLNELFKTASEAKSYQIEQINTELKNRLEDIEKENPEMKFT